MRTLLELIFSLDDEFSIWVVEEDLGNEKTFQYKNKCYAVKIPKKINKEITLRLRGLGKKRLNKTGDLYLHVWLNKGKDINKSIWISETSASNGAEKRLTVGGKDITMVIPPKSHNGITIRLKGLGKEAEFNPHAPPLRYEKRGDALVKLIVYPDSIRPKYESFGALSTDNMILEGWVYRKIDEVISKVGESFFRVKPLTADAVADLMNEWGWMGIFQALVKRLNLADLIIELVQSDSILQPGSCERTGHTYKITIDKQFLDNPFSIAAILAHELCHVFYSEKIEEKTITAESIPKSEEETLEVERTVDLLVFMYKIGEFQLRVARDKRLTLGYFNQEVFDRIQVIVTRKLGSF